MGCPGLILPARNGAATIAQTLRSILAQQGVPSLHVVVAVNGTTDATATIARECTECFARRGWEYDVICTPPGRANAMNAAELMLGSGDRLYVDQDAMLSTNAVATIGKTFANGCGVHFATPQLRLARSASWIVRNYYDVWERLPYVRDAPVTVGVYAVSATGRQRWGAFPAVHSDDKFARLHFSASERRRVAEAFYTVRPPDDLHALLAARTRYDRGNDELARRFPELMDSEGDRHAGLAHALFARPSQWPAAAAFATVHAAARLAALRS